MEYKGRKEIAAHLKAALDNRLSEEDKNLLKLQNIWHEIAEEKIAAHSSIIKFSNHELHLEIDHPATNMYFVFAREKILAAIQKRIPDLGVEKITCTLAETIKSKQI